MLLGETPALTMCTALLPPHHPPEQIVGEIENPNIAGVNSSHNRGSRRCQISSEQCCGEGNRGNDEQKYPIGKEEFCSRVFRRFEQTVVVDPGDEQRHEAEQEA